MDFKTRYYPKNQNGTKVAPTTLPPASTIHIDRDVFAKLPGEQEQIDDLKVQFEARMLDTYGKNWKKILRKEPAVRITF